MAEIALNCRLQCTHTNQKSDDNDTSAVFRFHAATFAALIIQSGTRTDWPASPPPLSQTDRHTEPRGIGLRWPCASCSAI